MYKEIVKNISMNFFIKFAFQLEIFIALVGHDFMQKPLENDKIVDAIEKALTGGY